MHWCNQVASVAVACVALLIPSLCGVAFNLVKDPRSDVDRAGGILTSHQVFHRIIFFPTSVRWFSLDLPSVWQSSMDKDPSAAAPVSRHPILLVIHGRSSSPDDMKNMLGEEIARAQNAGFLVAYANSTSIFNEKAWNSGACCAGALEIGVDDVQYIRDIFLHLHTQFRGDIQRVALLGMSNGGLMGHRLTCELAGDPNIQIKALVAHASSSPQKHFDNKCVGSMSWWRIWGIAVPVPPMHNWDELQCPYDTWQNLPEYYSCKRMRDVPVLLINGEADKIVPWAGGISFKGHETFASPPVAFLIRHYAEANGCGHSSSRVQSYVEINDHDEEDWTKCYSFEGCSANTTVCTHHKGGHSWQITKSFLPYTVSDLFLYLVGPFTQTFETSRQSIDFILRHVPHVE